MAKQKELSGTQETTDDIHAGRAQFSNAKAKELVGSNIFGPPPPDVPMNSRSSEMREESKSSDQPQPRNLHTSVKISNVSFKAFLCSLEMVQCTNLTLKVRVPWWCRTICKLSIHTVSNQGFKLLLQPAGGQSQISFGADEEIDAITHKLSGLKSAELSGHDIFSDENNVNSDKSQHHHLSQAKLKEITGHDIFSDDKPRSRDVLGGIKQPPGGVSSIALV